MVGDTTVTTVLNQSEYTITNPPDWKRLTDVVYSTDTVLTPSDEVSERQMDPLWTQRSNGTPARYWLSKPNTLRVFPKPATASVTINIRGIRTDATLDSLDDTPGCPAEFHEGIVLFAAWNVGKSYARGEDRQVVQRYYDEAMDYVERCREYLGLGRYMVLQRRVRRRLPDRMALGGSTLRY
jgi:hypothetical protein